MITQFLANKTSVRSQALAKLRHPSHPPLSSSLHVRRYNQYNAATAAYHACLSEQSALRVAMSIARLLV